MLSPQDRSINRFPKSLMIRPIGVTTIKNSRIIKTLVITHPIAVPMRIQTINTGFSKIGVISPNMRNVPEATNE